MDGLLLLFAAVAAVAAIRSCCELAVFLTVIAYTAVVVYLINSEMEILPVALLLAVVIAAYGLWRLLPAALEDWTKRHPGRHA